MIEVFGIAVCGLGRPRAGAPGCRAVAAGDGMAMRRAAGRADKQGKRTVPPSEARFAPKGIAV
ncbi:hypothetical protein N1F89_05610 [Aquibium sp. A9E412]|uniref:hypothetical protein n=1 Tax=Aquibium sp. A9E412 TaxID=2976767 RepID=UPI0025B25A91|nr:hypothetical protein [Aquibium sp. A9E412]MDN2565691.1 hypothetical protein [Aquibium sp. A9E412]